MATAAVGTGVYAAAHKTVTLDVDGKTTTVTTFSGSVDGLLEEQGITLTAGDVVAPNSRSALREGGDVVVRYQREVTLDRDGEHETAKTTALDAEELLSNYSSRGEDVALVASRSAGQERMDIGLRLNHDGPVAVLVDGENTIVNEGGTNIDEILAGQEITLGDEDRVSIQALPVGATSAVEDDEKDDEKKDSDTSDSIQIALEDSDKTMVTLVVQRIETKTTTKKTKVDFETVTKKDKDRYEDLPKYVATKGVKGQRVREYQVVTIDGEVQSKKKISDEITKKPIDEVVVVGTKERPEPTPEKTSTSSSSSSSSSKDSSTSTASVSGVWAKLAQCESGGNPSTNTGNGYYGLYQFSLPTWRSVGGSGLPSDASAAEQTKRAQILQQRAGWGQWPACARKLGLL
ncbi:transglycosylase family protein [Timonella sp. A28]|uniref:transglycosylase family protein n=1 Tax=Timonella sp. A28 TaxID=3442640 RepID=UPI003EBE83C1